MKRKATKFLGILLTTVMLVGTLTACTGGTDANKGTANPSTSPTPQASESTEPAANTEKTGADKSQQLIFYTNSGGDGRAEWLTEQAKTAGFNIQVVNLGAGALTERLVAEKNNQIADVVYGLNAMGFSRLKAAELLIQYTPEWADKVDATYGDPDGFFNPINIQPLLMIYNTDQYTADTAPKDWIDLATNPAFDGKHTVLALTGGTCQSIIASILVQYRDENGEHGISDEGWNVIKAYCQTGYVTVEGEDWFGNAVNGTRPITQIWGSGLIQREDELGVTNMEYVRPQVGVPYVIEQIAICKNSKKVDLAEEFIDWFGSEELQTAWVETYGTVPANVDVMDSASERAQEMMENNPQQNIDWVFVANNIELWMEKIQLEYVK